MLRALGLVLLLAGAGCQPRTEVVIGLLSDLKIPDGLDAVALDARRDDVPVVQPIWPRDAPLILPGSFGLYSPDGSATDLTVIVTGFHQNHMLMTRTAQVTLIPGRTLFMRMALASACASVASCKSDETCIDGACAPLDVDARTLPDFTPDLVDAIACASGPSWVNGASGEPLPVGSGCPSGGVCREGACYLAPQ